MSKNERRIKIRRFWKIKPATRVKQSAKIYKRPEEKPKIEQEIKELPKGSSALDSINEFYREVVR